MDQRIKGVLLGVAGVVLWFMPFTAWDTELFGVTMHFEHAGHDVGGVAYLLLFSSLAYATFSWFEEHTLRIIAAAVATGICVALYFKFGSSNVTWGLPTLFAVSAFSFCLSIWDDRCSKVTPPSTRPLDSVAQPEVSAADVHPEASLRSRLISAAPVANDPPTASLGSSLISSSRAPAIKRPASVTVIAWILIASGGFNLVMTAVGMGNPLATEIMSKGQLPISVQYALGFIGLGVTMVSGIAMLNGKNWGKLAYVISNPIFFIIGIATSPMKAILIPGFLLFLVAAFLLFRPNATEYFSAETPSKYA